MVGRDVNSADFAGNDFRNSSLQDFVLAAKSVKMCKGPEESGVDLRD